MKKFFSLLKGIMSQDMNIFIYSSKKNASKSSRVLVPIFLAALVMFSIGSMFYGLAEALNESGNLYLLLTLAILAPTLLSLIEGIYKSQGILFEAKDSDLLFSLPISKRMVVLARLIKLYVFQFLYSLLFTIPGVAVYAIFAKPDAYFYVMTALMLVLLPIIPTVVGAFLGYIIKRFSVKFKSKKIIETIITFALVLLIMFLSSGNTGLINSINENATTIDGNIKLIYYPIKAYTELVQEFNIITLLLWLLINIAFVVVFVLICSKTYFEVVSKSKENSQSSTKHEAIEYSFKKKSQLSSLIKKEFTRLTSSVVYMVNTMFGLLLLIIGTIALCTNFQETILYISSEDLDEEQVSFLMSLAPKIFLVVVLGVSFLTSITASSISLEGKSFNISKSLPISPDKQLLAKVLMSDMVTIPVILICDVIFFSSFDVTIVDILVTLLASFIAPSISAVFGLLANLKHPKMDASSDAEVVKQSTSSMISVLVGILAAMFFGSLTLILAGLGDLAMIAEIALLGLLLVVLWAILSNYGKKRFTEIEV